MNLSFHEPLAERPKREVVIWSGGYDSTAILHEVSKDSSVERPTVAFVMAEHTQLNQTEMVGQRAARAAYLAAFPGLGAP